MRGRFGSPVGSLPAEVTSFVGRHQESTHVKRLLSSSRLVTLTGVGGVGKSRLALRVAREVQREYPDGVWLVELAKLREPSLVNHAVVDALELRNQSAREPAAVLAEYLADKRLLLLVDNCEHVLGGCRRLAAALLAHAPGVAILATSRESLGVSGERIFAVPPLSVPPPADSEDPQADGAHWPSEAMSLFESRAAAVAAGFATRPENWAAVASVCQRLEGLPLAIELAAVRVRALSVPQLLARMEDRYRLLTRGGDCTAPLRQTLRSAFEQSYELCSNAERILWMRASIFAGGFDLDAAERVCAGEGLPTDRVLSAVAGLIDKSILQRHESGSLVRYRMLETLREYGRERLMECDEPAEVRRRHRDYYLRLAEAADAGSFGPRQVDWFARLREDHANFWVALEYCLTEPGQARSGLRMAASLWVYWIACGRVREGRHWLDRMLAADGAPSRQRARALWVDGWVACMQGDTDAALVLLEECRELAPRLGDAQALTRAIQFTGLAYMFRNEYPRAVPLLDEALARDRASGEVSGASAMAFVHRADAAGMLGEVDLAGSLCRDATACCHSHGELWAQSWLRWWFGLIAWKRGALRTAAGHIRVCLQTKAELNDRLGVPFCVEGLAWIASSAGEFPHAAALLGIAETMWQEIGAQLFGYESMLRWSNQCTEATRNALGDQAFEDARQRGRQLSFDDAVARALGRKQARDRTVDAAQAPPQITSREWEVATLVAHGLSNQEVADRLAISRRTAECHVAHIFGKLGITSRAQVAGWVRGRGPLACPAASHG
jgi:predicted ATPase/DNA-binding CsgD family transcriptional regulator